VTASTTVLELADIQGDILRAYGNSYERTSYVFVNVADAARGRDWLGGLVERVTTAEPWRGGHKPETALNLAVTAAGVEALGVPKEVRDTFAAEFLDGMAKRAPLLGDTGPSAPERWEPGLGTGEAHVMVTINALTEELLDSELAPLRAGVEQAGLRIVNEQHARLLPGVREHFGYADGFSQPAIEGATDDKAAGGGVPTKDGWRPLAPGELILGYEDEDSRDDPKRTLPSAPADPLGRNGTYVFYRKLHQDVALFRRTLRDAARLFAGGDEELLRAKVVGRWPNGTPLMTSPDRPVEGFSPDQPGANDFRYFDEDPGGRRCPIGAHIRRSNPRDSLGWEGMLTFRHRIVRRGMPYGPPLPDGAEDDGVERGLVFVGFNASISRQFEAIQIQWLNDGNIFHLGHDKDFLVGDSAGTGKMTVEGDPPFFLAPARSFVVTMGGEYLFAPGIRALRALAAGLG
jgi:Dyp-type peroxidase family